jgi:hypothetical protein
MLICQTGEFEAVRLDPQGREKMTHVDMTVNEVLEMVAVVHEVRHIRTHEPGRGNGEIFFRLIGGVFDSIRSTTFHYIEKAVALRYRAEMQTEQRQRRRKNPRDPIPS